MIVKFLEINEDQEKVRETIDRYKD